MAEPPPPQPPEPAGTPPAGAYPPGPYQPGAYPPGPYQPGAYPPGPYQPPKPPKPRHPQAITVVVLGSLAAIGGLFTGITTILGPIAWALGARAKREVAAEPGRWADEDLVTVGYVLGIVATVMLALGLMATAIVVVVIVGLFSG